MPRRPDIVRSILLHTTIPEDLWTRMTLRLYSEVEGRVPKGAYKEFICRLIREEFNREDQANARSSNPN